MLVWSEIRRRHGANYAGALLLGAAACLSPTAFDSGRDVEMTVEDAVARLNPNESLTASLTVSISNSGLLTVTFLEWCGVAVLLRDGERLFGFSYPCALSSTVDIEPGGQAVVSVEATAPRGDWGQEIDGEYRLELGLFIEGVSRAELVESTPFRITFSP